ncbi:hypothetical protein HJG60_010654 [Phyllostomus discolor]|uniref:Uncharacterized protein n=1 Tax=Phyllostomus discolor TaxID=89673 RepID=A0A834ALQ4_9CHIR|nr:hypothetical protein HJG60_010654 [Phyllostomus discolor]
MVCGKTLLFILKDLPLMNLAIIIPCWLWFYCCLTLLEITTRGSYFAPLDILNLTVIWVFPPLKERWKKSGVRPSGLMWVKLPGADWAYGCLSTSKLQSRPHQGQLASWPPFTPWLGPLAFWLLGEKAVHITQTLFLSVRPLLLVEEASPLNSPGLLTSPLRGTVS